MTSRNLLFSHFVFHNHDKSLCLKSTGYFRTVQQQKNWVKVQGNNKHFVLYKTKEKTNNYMYSPELRLCSVLLLQHNSIN